MKNYQIILLAAGGSTRMGTPKQLLPYNGKTLVQQALDTAQAVLRKPVVIVTGARNEIVEPGNRVYIVHNQDWKEGIASSIRAGLTAALKANPRLDAVIFIVCDQPHMTTHVLKELMDVNGSTGKEIVASTYAGTVGIPALFGKSFFDQLMQLKGDEGAKKIIIQNRESAAVVDFPRGDIDIDTKADYQRLKSGPPRPV